MRTQHPTGRHVAVAAPDGTKNSPAPPKGKRRRRNRHRSKREVTAGPHPRDEESQERANAIRQQEQTTLQGVYARSGGMCRGNGAEGIEPGAPGLPPPSIQPTQPLMQIGLESQRRGEVQKECRPTNCGGKEPPLKQRGIDQPDPSGRHDEGDNPSRANDQQPQRGGKTGTQQTRQGDGLEPETPVSEERHLTNPPEYGGKKQDDSRNMTHTTQPADSAQGSCKCASRETSPRSAGTLGSCLSGASAFWERRGGSSDRYHRGGNP